MCRFLSVLVVICCSHYGYSQELGYAMGLSKEGINAQKFQPVYGFTFGKTFSRYFGLESYFLYSQRTVQATTQADYISFVVMPKAGYFFRQGGVYYAPALALNPTLHHSNVENHTYLSTIQALGIQVNLTPNIFLDLKGGYDIGITRAYLSSGSYQKYNGPILIGSIKFRLDHLNTDRKP